MLEKALSGSRAYWSWIFALLVVIGGGVACWFWQFNEGLTITGLSRDVVWGFYIAQFTFLVGVAASAVMVVLPYYLARLQGVRQDDHPRRVPRHPRGHHVHAFIFVDMGMPNRILNVFLHPTVHSMMFWDTVALGGYLVLNIVISHWTLVVRAARRAAAEVAQTDHPALHPVGGLDPHGHRLPVCRSRGTTLLDDGDPGAAIPGLGLCRGPRDPAPARLLRAQGLDLRPGQAGHRHAGQDRHLRHDRSTSSSCSWSSSPRSTATSPSTSITSSSCSWVSRVRTPWRRGCGCPRSWRSWH